VLSDDTTSAGGEEGGSDDAEAEADTDADADSSGAASGAEAMPTVADAGPVDGEAGEDEEFNG
jgi:hypothetical protein